MYNKDLVSIVMPTFNCGEYIRETIKTVLQQTYNNWELIIIDDASSDNTSEVVEEFVKKDNRIKYSTFKENSGAAAARNMAIELAGGRYIAFLDSDDLWYPSKLEKQIEFMQKNNYAISCTAYEQIDEKGRPVGKIIKTIKRTDYNRLLLDCPVGNSTVMYDVSKLGKFEVPNIRKRNDDALWLQMLKKEKYIWGMPEVLMKYRIRGNSISSNKLKVIKYHWILYRQIEHLGVLRSAFHIAYWCAIKVIGIK